MQCLKKKLLGSQTEQNDWAEISGPNALFTHPTTGEATRPLVLGRTVFPVSGRRQFTSYLLSLALLLVRALRLCYKM